MSKSDRDRKSVAFAAHFLSSDSTFVDIYQEQKKPKTTLTDLLFLGANNRLFSSVVADAEVGDKYCDRSGNVCKQGAECICVFFVWRRIVTNSRASLQ